MLLVNYNFTSNIFIFLHIYVGSYVELQPGDLRYTDSYQLDLYVVKDTSIGALRESSTHGGLRVQLTFSRRLFATFVATYLPTGLICIVCFATNYFYSFEAAVTVNLTCLLVLTTIFIGVADSLPNTSYIKLIDIWLLFTLMVPLMEVFLHTYIHYQTMSKKLEVEECDPDPNHSRVELWRRGTVSRSRVSGVSSSNSSRSVKGSEDLQDNRKDPPNKLKALWSDLVTSDQRGLIVAEHAARIGLPLAFVAFTIGYFTGGLCLIYD